MQLIIQYLTIPQSVWWEYNSESTGHSKSRPPLPPPRDIDGDWFSMMCKKRQIPHHVEKYFAGNAQNVPPPGQLKMFLMNLSLKNYTGGRCTDLNNNKTDSTNTCENLCPPSWVIPRSEMYPEVLAGTIDAVLIENESPINAPHSSGQDRQNAWILRILEAKSCQSGERAPLKLKGPLWPVHNLY